MELEDKGIAHTPAKRKRAEHEDDVDLAATKKPKLAAPAAAAAAAIFAACKTMDDQDVWSVKQVAAIKKQYIHLLLYAADGKDQVAISGRDLIHRMLFQDSSGTSAPRRAAFGAFQAADDNLFESCDAKKLAQLKRELDFCQDKLGIANKDVVAMPPGAKSFYHCFPDSDDVFHWYTDGKMHCQGCPGDKRYCPRKWIGWAANISESALTFERPEPVLVAVRIDGVEVPVADGKLDPEVLGRLGSAASVSPSSGRRTT